ncbi:MAG: hypothetical protein V1887_02320 [Candidatus Aenigmatarchaeota archaeon]
MKRRSKIILAAVAASLAFCVIAFSDEIRYLTNSINANAICFPDSSKDKISFIIAENGTYDNEKVSLQISKYFDSVKKDLSIDNAGIKKFPGKTVDELDKFVDDLYLNDDVGYIILLGDNLPVANVTENDATNQAAIYEKLSCVNGDCLVRKERGDSPTVTGQEAYYRCHDVAISYILPPIPYSDSEKIDFVLKILETYTDYHNNFATHIGKYQKSMLHIADPYFVGDCLKSSIDNPILRYDLPVITISGTEREKVFDELKNKYLILHYGIHGSTWILQLTNGCSNESIQPQTLRLSEYSNFTKEYGTPALFVAPGACEAMTIRDDLDPWELSKYPERRHCCWPQIFMESGAWAYYYMPHGRGNTFLYEKTIGLAIRKSNVEQFFIFGDILAHMR